MEYVRLRQALAALAASRDSLRFVASPAVAGVRLWLALAKAGGESGIRAEHDESRATPEFSRDVNRRSMRAEVGGERGIRTPGTVSRTAVFKTACFNHSHISPFIYRRGPLHPAWRASLALAPFRARSLSYRRGPLHPAWRASLALAPFRARSLLIGGVPLYFSFSLRSSPRMYGRRASGITIEPSFCW